MVKLIKAIFLFILLLFLGFLLTATFLSSDSRGEVSNISEQLGDFQSGYYTFGSGGLVYDGIQRIEEPQLYAQKISVFETIYVSESESNDTYVIKNDGNNVDISLGNGIYVLDLNNPTKKYSISSDGFLIDYVSLGKIYIDTTDITDIKIISMSTLVDISFLDRETQQVLTQLYMLPNMYLGFNVLDNNGLNNADFLRISQLATYSYFHDSIYENNILSDKLISLIGDEKAQNLETILSGITQHSASNYDDYDYLASINIWEFPGVNYLKQRLDLFKNNTKKTVFYKNLVLQDLDTLFDVSDYRPSYTNDIITHLDILRELNQQEYDNMIQLIKQYSSVVLSYYDYTQQDKKNNFKHLLYKIEDSSYVGEFTSFYILSDIYEKYNFIDSSSHLEDIPIFTQAFFDDIGVEKKGGSITSVEDTNVRLREHVSGYLQGLIQKVLISQKDRQTNSDILYGLLNIVNDHISLSTYVYFSSQSSSDTSRKQTGLEQNLRFLEILELFLKKALFETQRDSSDLLVVKNASGLKAIIEQLKESTEILEDLYDRQKQLTGANLSKLFGYQRVIPKLDEYFLALTNYDLYKRTYQEDIKDVRGTDVFSGDDDQGLSKQAFISYISDFDGIDTSQAEVDVVDEQYYRVTGLKVSGVDVGFKLYPISGNTIQDIFVDNNRITGTYILDQRQFDLEEKYRSAGPEERDQYDFKKFFINTLFAQQTETGTDFVIDDDSLNEPKEIISFKKEKLLGEGKEFDFVTSYLPLKWSNVIVAYPSYDISINDALYIGKDNNSQYYGEFNSNYIFSDTTHQFIDISVRMYERYTQYRGERFEIDGEAIMFTGPVFIGDFNNVSEKFFISYTTIKSVYRTLNTQVDASNISIEYNPNTNSGLFRFVLSGENYELNIFSGAITYVKNQGKTIADNVKPGTLADVLNNLSQ